MEKKPKVIIIKKVKKGGGGHHGGSWKVAYADFVTAMMAFFLLMWLLSMVSPEKRAVMALYFKNFSLFEHGGKSFMMEGGIKPVFKSGGQEYYETEEAPGKTGLSEEEQLKGMLLTGVGDKTKSLQGSVLVDVSEEGVRIQITDTREKPIFPAGSAALSEDAKKILGLVAGTMKDLPNKIVIEGHTDASHTRNEEISNWELSALRASAARRELENCGLDPRRIAHVAGYADKVPLIKEDPEDPRNRRVSIVFLFSKKKPKSKDPYDWVWSPDSGKTPGPAQAPLKSKGPYDWVWNPAQQNK